MPMFGHPHCSKRAAVADDLTWSYLRLLVASEPGGCLELGADGRFAHAASAADGRIDPVPGCAGLVLDVDALWAEVDRLDEEKAEEEPRRALLARAGRGDP